MPVLYILIFLSLILLWFLLSPMYKPLGKLGYKLFKGAKDKIIEEEEDENKNNKDKKE